MSGGVLYLTRHSKSREVNILLFSVVVVIKCIMRVTKKQTHRERKTLVKYMP